MYNLHIADFTVMNYFIELGISISRPTNIHLWFSLVRMFYMLNIIRQFIYCVWLFQIPYGTMKTCTLMDIFLHFTLSWTANLIQWELPFKPRWSFSIWSRNYWGSFFRHLASLIIDSKLCSLIGCLQNHSFVVYLHESKLDWIIQSCHRIYTDGTL